VLENKETGQQWQLTAPSGGATTKNGHFVVLQTPLSTSTLTVLDNRTGKTYEIPIDPKGSTINATSFEQIKGPGPSQHGLLVYDPAYTNTAVAKSAICFIDGDEGILRYRGKQVIRLTHAD